MKTLGIVISATLVAMLAVGFTPAASAASSCTVFGTGTCTFTCSPGEQVFVGAAGPEAVVGSCGEGTTACVAPTGSSLCQGTTLPLLTGGTGTCVAVGTNVATCEAH